jgi:hypothetical protein
MIQFNTTVEGLAQASAPHPKRQILHCSVIGLAWTGHWVASRPSVGVLQWTDKHDNCVTLHRFAEQVVLISATGVLPGAQSMVRSVQREDFLGLLQAEGPCNQILAVSQAGAIGIVQDRAYRRPRAKWQFLASSPQLARVFTEWTGQPQSQAARETPKPVGHFAPLPNHHVAQRQEAAYS